MASQEVKQAKEFFKKVSEESERFRQAIPDKSLGEKLRKVGEGAGEVVKHISERCDPKQGG